MLRDNGFPASHEWDNALEAAINLVYLIRVDRNDPAKVLQWSQLADSQLQAIVDALRHRQD